MFPLNFFSDLIFFFLNTLSNAVSCNQLSLSLFCLNSTQIKVTRLFTIYTVFQLRAGPVLPNILPLTKIAHGLSITSENPFLHTCPTCPLAWLQAIFISSHLQDSQQRASAKTMMEKENPARQVHNLMNHVSVITYMQHILHSIPHLSSALALSCTQGRILYLLTYQPRVQFR